MVSRACLAPSFYCASVTYTTSSVYKEASGHKVNIEDGLPNRSIDLEKLFTPASDSGEITPSRSRKVYASSSFYASDHPTMEEQVDLARRISHSLSDISNKESKGQSMYVNRKKRSVKWVHEGEGVLPESEFENVIPSQKKDTKPPLKLVMNPRGQVQDINMFRKQGFVVDPMTPMSPDICFDLVRDLNAPKGKGAELFAKRRKRSENWIIDENNVKTPDTTMFQSPLSKLPPLSYLQGSTQKAENVQKMNQIQEKFSQPKLKLIKSPWEAALEGSVESAFQEVRQSPRGMVMAPTPTTLQRLVTPPPPSPPIKGDLYKPKPPKAWNPQPTCRSFSSVKLEKIFAGSPRSPVSLAYHPETNTISTEPVIVENIPPIATELSGYEVLDESILHEPRTRRPDEFLIYEPIVSKTMDAPSTKKEERAIVQNNNIVTLMEDESNKSVTESRLKHASQTIEKKVTFKINEEMELSSAEINSELTNTKYITDNIEKMSDNSTLDNRLCCTKNNEPISNGEILSMSQNNLFESIKHSEIEKSEEVVIPSDSYHQADNKTIEKIAATSSENNIKSQFTQPVQQIQKRNPLCHQLEIEQETISADEEVEDLCEREFNELSLEYEKIQKREVKKSALQVAGAVPIFAGVDFSAVKKPEEITPKFEKKPEEIANQFEKKSFRKPGSLVPGAKPLFGNAIGDIHVSINETDGPDRPYEKIPVKSLISTFEQSTRPQMKYKQMQDKIPDAVSPNKFLYKEMQSEQKHEFEQESTKIEQKSIPSLTDSMQCSLIPNLPTFPKDTVKEKIDNMNEEEVQRIQQHYELQKHKKEIYDQQMQKYKEEMKQLRSTKKQSVQVTKQNISNMEEKQTVTSRISALEQTNNFTNGSYYDGGQSNLIIRSEENAPKTPSTPYQPPVYTSTSQVSHVNYSGNNFNTAARGWQKSMSYYRPVVFNQPTPAYTDF